MTDAELEARAARRAYEQFCHAFRGNGAVPWSKQSPGTREQWLAIARAVLREAIAKFVLDFATPPDRETTVAIAEAIRARGGKP